MEYQTIGTGPTNKVAAATGAATLAGAIATILFYVIAEVRPNDPLPTVVQLAVGVIITAIITGGSTFLAGYLTKPKADDGLKAVPTEPK